jgi:hypothetical protein
MSANDPLSPAELAFIELQRKPRLFAQWANVCRKNWTARRLAATPEVGAGANPSQQRSGARSQHNRSQKQ